MPSLNPFYVMVMCYIYTRGRFEFLFRRGLKSLNLKQWIDFYRSLSFLLVNHHICLFYCVYQRTCKCSKLRVLMYYGFMALSMYRTRKLCKNLGVIGNYDVFLLYCIGNRVLRQDREKEIKNWPREKQWKASTGHESIRKLSNILVNEVSKIKAKFWILWVGSTKWYTWFVTCGSNSWTRCYK